MRTVLRVLVVLVALFCASFVAAAKCDVKLPDGSYYDFTKLSTTTTKAKLSTSTFVYMILFRFCGVTDDIMACNPSSSFCLTDENSTKAIKALGSWTDGHKPDVFTPIDNGISIAYNSPTDGVTMLLKCGDASVPVAERIENGFLINFTHPAGCKTSPSSGGGGLSGGWVFIIILLVSSFLYVVIGCAVCIKKYDRRGLDACPNKAFWAAIPGLTKDGCLFTIAKLKGCCGGRGGSEKLSDDSAGYGTADV